MADSTKQSPTSPSQDRTAQRPSFEESMERLAQIVQRLESGELALEDSLKLFEEGVTLARISQAQLDQAERRVEELLSIDEEGNPVVRELEQE
jgi:exodeoxyribonuclease VII small subunit